MILRNVQLPNAHLSEIVYLPEGDLELVMTLAPMLKTEDLPKNAPRLHVPTEINDFYLIVLSDPENEILPLRILPVNIKDKQPEIGEPLWINTTEHTVTGTLGGELFSITPESRVISKPPLPASGYYKAVFQNQINGEGESLLVMRKSWWYDAGSKNLGFIVISKRISPKIFAMRDRFIQ